MTQLMMATALGECHGCINTITNSVAFDDFKNMTPANKAKLEKEKKEDSRLVKVEYLNSRGRHERLTKPYCKYSGDPITIWHFIPGKIYDVPLGLVKEVNEQVGIKRSGLVQSDNDLQGTGAPLEKDAPADWKHKFVPVGFN